MMAIAVDQEFFNPHKKEMDKKTSIIEKVAKTSTSFWQMALPSLFLALFHNWYKSPFLCDLFHKTGKK